jgi:hypothetical protein
MARRKVRRGGRLATRRRLPHRASRARKPPSKVRIYYESDFYVAKRRRLTPVIRSRLVEHKAIARNYYQARKKLTIAGRKRTIYKHAPEEKTIAGQHVTIVRRQREQQQSKRLELGKSLITNYDFSTPPFFIVYDAAMAYDNARMNRFFLSVMKDRQRRHGRIAFYRLQVQYVAYDNAEAAGRAIGIYSVGGSVMATKADAIAECMSALDNAVSSGESGTSGVVNHGMVTFIEEE